jgi:hypothetical protein
MNKIARAVYQAKKDGSKISANIRLKKNGQFSSVSGKVEDLKVSRDGFAYATVKVDEKDKLYQNVRLENILCLNKDNKLYKR